MQAATAYAPESPAKLNATGDVGQGYKDSLSSLHAMLNQGTNLNQVDFTQATLEAIDACCGGGCLTEGGKNNSQLGNKAYSSGHETSRYNQQDNKTTQNKKASSNTFSFYI